MKATDGTNREIYGFSGGHIEQFREGWAVLPFCGKPHYFRRKDLTHVYTALCGFTVDQTHYHPGTRKQFEPGVFMSARCGNCQRKRQKETRFSVKLG